MNVDWTGRVSDGCNDSTPAAQAPAASPRGALSAATAACWDRVLRLRPARSLPQVVSSPQALALAGQAGVEGMVTSHSPGEGLPSFLPFPTAGTCGALSLRLLGVRGVSG